MKAPSFRKMVRLPLRDAVDHQLTDFLKDAGQESAFLQQEWMRSSLRRSFVEMRLAELVDKDKPDAALVEIVKAWLESVERGGAAA